MPERKKNIILTGFMAVGKSTVGKQIAKKIGWNFIDSDTLIEKRAGLSVEDIFTSYGEAKFRHMEKELATDLSQEEKLVIATGGGFFLTRNNIAMLSKKGEIFTLTASVEELVKRIKTDPHSNRPLLKNTPDIKTTIAQQLNDRLPIYNQFIQINTEDYAISAISDKIICLFCSKTKL